MTEFERRELVARWLWDYDRWTEHWDDMDDWKRDQWRRAADRLITELSKAGAFA